MWHYRLSPEKSLKLEKLFLIFNPSPNVAPKPIGRSRSHSIPRILLQISLTLFYVFDLLSKVRVDHIRKKIKIFIFSKMAPTIFIKFCDFIVHSNPKNIVLSAFPGKIVLTRKIFFNFLSAPNVTPKPTDQSCSNSILGFSYNYL